MDLPAWRDRLLAAEYRFDLVVDRLGPVATASLGRNSTVAARRRLADDPQSTLIRLWLLHDALPEVAVARALGPSVSELLAAGLLEKDGELVRAAVEIRPYADDDGVDAWVVADLIPGLDGEVAPMRPDFVLGASAASATLTQISDREPATVALDLGTGCGLQSLHLARRAQKVIATDLNPRAIKLARITAGLANIEVDFRLGSLYEPVADALFDQIVSNPPYVMAPPASAALTYREGGLVGDELVRQVIVEGGRRLAPEGRMQVLANWAIVAGQPWEDRVSGWVNETGCDGLIVLRERLDPAQYIEIWLADAGLSGPAYRQRYAEWLDYFDALDLEAVGMGWFSLVNSGRARPSVTCEILPNPVVGPVAESLAAHHHGLAVSEAEAEILGRRWVLNDRVRQETIGLPGAADPEGIEMRQYYGLGRRLRVDTALAAILGACDGDLTLAQIISAVANVLGRTEADLQAEVLPRIREFICQDWFVLESGKTAG